MSDIYVWWIKINTGAGEECYTVRADTIGELARRIGDVRSLVGLDRVPAAPAAPAQDIAQAAYDTLTAAGEKLCPIHGVPMTRREKDGAVWYSHQLPDGTWCRGGNGRKK